MEEPSPYTEDMKIFVSATEAKTPQTKASGQMAYVLAALLTIMLVGQLFTFETFIEWIASLGLPLGDMGVYLIASIIVIAELLALPFLLRMALSPAFRWVSMVFGWIAVSAWIFFSAWTLFVAPVDLIAFIGTVAPVAPGWWALLISIALGFLTAWVSWGLWPGARSAKKQLPKQGGKRMIGITKD